jgi:radical SAM protein with 4Fe4S-binding SPASM domain
MVKESGRRPRMISQIIDLPGHVTKEEIKKFRRFWHDRGVEVQVWEELTWGVKVDPKRGDYRYPCFSLWESFNINADGKVTACCMDWEQKLVLGDFSRQTIAEIWKGDKLEEYRRLHVCNEIDRMPPCITCNYWRWQPMIGKYRVGP